MPNKERTDEARAILIIYTGGTIGMVKDPVSGLLKPLDFQHLLNQIPELKQFGFIIDTLTFDPVVDSSEIQPGFWIKLAQTIYDHYGIYDGFVILHGTDTMAFTASALSFLLRNLGKPVILTGSQLPIGTLRTDGKENLISSIEIAADTYNGNPVVPEVCIYFEYKLFKGNRTTKYSAETFNAFQSPNYPLLAESGVHIQYNHDAITKPEDNKPVLLTKKLNTNVTFLKLYPGISEKVVNSILHIDGLEAVILETYGAGNAPRLPWFINALSAFIQKGGIIVNISQCMVGLVDMAQYETGNTLHQIGVISGRDMTPEAAVTKLMFVLGTASSISKRKSLLELSICGEIS
ncbi:MAG: type I asparaginase [Chlorobi bacterium]|nr:type I asparaginase [Chlorobiota bacterium]